MEKDPLPGLDALEDEALHEDAPWDVGAELDEIEHEIDAEDDPPTPEDDGTVDAATDTDDAAADKPVPAKDKPADIPEATGGSSTSRMLMEIGRKYPLLTPKAEKDLARRIERGDLMAKDTLFYSNVRLVASNAKKYLGQGLEYDELVQEGFLGLMRAVEKFDYRKDFRFSTYATNWIKQAIQRALENKARTIRLPNHVAQKTRKIERASTRLSTKLGRVATVAEIADATNLEAEKVEELQEDMKRTSTVSLDKPVGDEGDSTLGDLAASTGPDEVLEEVIRNERLEDLERAFRVAKLTERERLVLLHRFGLAGDGPEKTQQETGETLELPRGSAATAERNALHKLRMQKQRVSEILKEAA